MRLTSGVEPVSRAGWLRRIGAMASHTSVGVERPRRVTGGCAAQLIDDLARAYVMPQISTPPAGASDWRRDAVLTTSPATIAWPPSRAAATSTIASPVATPTRKRRLRAGSS